MIGHCMSSSDQTGTCVYMDLGITNTDQKEGVSNQGKVLGWFRVKKIPTSLGTTGGVGLPVHTEKYGEEKNAQ